MEEIENYNSSYPLAYYDIGSVYTFYCSDYLKYTPATCDEKLKYATILESLQKEDNSIKPVRKNKSSENHRRLHRFYGIIVDKTDNGKNSHLSVMFCNEINGKADYYTCKYTVNRPCETNGKDLMTALPCLHININGKIGGITIVDPHPGIRIGGITQGGGNKPQTTTVGGITKVVKGGQKGIDTANGIGGITKSESKEECAATSSNNKVGGITKL